MVDFPLFTRCPSTGKKVYLIKTQDGLLLLLTYTGMLESSHHPFTAPQPDDVTLVSTSPEKVCSCKYGLFCEQAIKVWSKIISLCMLCDNARDRVPLGLAEA